MSVSELCIRRPVMTVLVMLSLVVLGIAGFRESSASAPNASMAMATSVFLRRKSR